MVKLMGVKYLWLWSGLVFFSSCVSSKRYKKLENHYTEISSALVASQKEVLSYSDSLTQLRYKLIVANKNVENKEVEIEHYKSDIHEKNKTIEQFKKDIGFLQEAGNLLNDRINELTETNRMNTEVMKKLMENMETQNLKVLNLSLALEKMDSTAIQQVKKSRKAISERKVKQSLEKLGFVFY